MPSIGANTKNRKAGMAGLSVGLRLSVSSVVTVSRRREYYGLPVEVIGVF
jgi:hypothetical protein